MYRLYFVPAFSSSALIRPSLQHSLISRDMARVFFCFNGFSMLRTRSVRNNKPSTKRMDSMLRYIIALSLDSDDCSGRHNISD